MPNSFVAVDVETANANLASICQIGIAAFADNRVASTWSTLLDPETYFDGMNVSIHGIDESAVRGAPTFPDISDHLMDALHDQIVVSHMPFDRAAITRAQERYGLPGITCTWLDTARVVRRVWPQFARSGYGLANVAEWCGIEFRHHDALEDARAAGAILLRAMADSDLDVAEWVERSRQPIGGAGGAHPTVKRTGRPDGPLSGEVVCFTGALSIPRREAADVAADAGCDVATTVGSKVTLLVVGDQDIQRLGGHAKSSKHRKAEDLIKAGQPIRIVGETDFRSLITEAKA